MSINLSFHAKYRYVERIVGVAEDTEIRRYMTLNEEKINSDIGKMFEHAEFIYKGQLGGDKTTKNFWLRDDIILVTDTGNTILVTLYRVDFRLPTKNKEAIQDLKTEIFRLKEEHEKEMAGLAEILEQIDSEISQIDSDIKILKDQLDILEQKKKFKQAEKQNKADGAILISKQLDMYAHQLCNLFDFQKDLKKDMKV